MFVQGSQAPGAAVSAFLSKASLSLEQLTFACATQAAPSAQFQTALLVTSSGSELSSTTLSTVAASLEPGASIYVTAQVGSRGPCIYVLAVAGVGTDASDARLLRVVCCLAGCITCQRSAAGFAAGRIPRLDPAGALHDLRPRPGKPPFSRAPSSFSAAPCGGRSAGMHAKRDTGQESGKMLLFLQVQAKKPSWERGAKAALTLKRPVAAPSSAPVSAAQAWKLSAANEDEDMVDEDELLTAEDKQALPAVTADASECALYIQPHAPAHTR